VQGSFETIKHINSAYIVVTFQNLKKKKEFLYVRFIDID